MGEVLIMKIEVVAVGEMAQQLTAPRDGSQLSATTISGDLMSHQGHTWYTDIHAEETPTQIEKKIFLKISPAKVHGNF